MASESKSDTSTFHHLVRPVKATSPPIIDPYFKPSLNSPSVSDMQQKNILQSSPEKNPAKSIEKSSKLAKANSDINKIELPLQIKAKIPERKDAFTQDNLLAVTIFREDYEHDFPEAVELRLVPLNLEVQKLMILHGLNPRISTRCRLVFSLNKVISYLKEHIAKGRNIETIIGRKNEIKLAPEMEQIREASRAVNKKDEEKQEEQNFIVWSQSCSENIIVKDLYVAMRKADPIYLYYFWDEIPVSSTSSNEALSFNKESYYQKKGKDDLLEHKEYEDFIEMVSQVVHNVIDKKRGKRRGHKTQKKEPQENPAKSKRVAPEFPSEDNAFSMVGRTPKDQQEGMNAVNSQESLSRYPIHNSKGSVRRRINFEDSESELFPSLNMEECLGMDLHPSKEFSSPFKSS